jgi:hypothetical protein
MSKKKKHKRFGNPAAEAQRLRAELEQPAANVPPATEAPAGPTTGFTAASELRAEQASVTAIPEAGEDGVVRITDIHQLLAMYNQLQAQSVKIQEEFINLQSDFNRVLQSYTALITNTFKLNITMDEFDINEPRTVERLQSKFSFFIEDLPRNCEKAGIRMPNLVGLDYTPGLNVEALNADEFEPGTALEIDEVVEPLLIFDPKNTGAASGSVRASLKNGLVTVKKKGE